MLVVARDGGGDEAMGGAYEQRDFRQSLGPERARSLAAPVLAEARPPPQVADAGAAATQEARERPRLRREVQRGAHRVHGLLERGAHVRRAQGDHVPDVLRPRAAAMAGAAG